MFSVVTFGNENLIKTIKQLGLSNIDFLHPLREKKKSELDFQSKFELLHNTRWFS